MNVQETTSGQPPTTTATPEMPPLAPPPPTQAAAVPLPTRRYAPGLAAFLSALPGLGHLYLGLYQRAFMVFGAFAVAIWLADHADAGILVPFAWFFGVFDAYRQAVNINSGVSPEPVTGTSYPKAAKRGGLGLGVFLTVVGVILLYNQFYPLDFSFLETWWPLVLVIAGVWLLARHFVEQKRRQAAEDALQQQ